MIEPFLLASILLFVVLTLLASTIFRNSKFPYTPILLIGWGTVVGAFSDYIFFPPFLNEGIKLIADMRVGILFALFIP
jgi:hypothetical protein